MLDKKKIMKIDVYTIGGRLIVSSYMFNISEESVQAHARHQILIKSNNIPDTEKGTPVQVVLYFPNGDRQNYDTTVDVCTDFQMNVTIGDKFTLLDERRRFYKLETDLTTKIILLTRGGEDTIFEEPIPGRFKNINIGGVFLCTKFELFAGDTIVLRFEMLGKPLDLTTQVLRAQKNDNEILGYGCSFMKLQYWQEEIIARYIHKIQCEQIDTLKHTINSR